MTPSPAPPPGGTPSASTAEPGLAAVLIHEAVSRRAAERPHATALVADGLVLTYAALEAAAEAAADELTAAGVRPRDIVPVVLPRSARLVVTLLAVLKCGAAYAALDRRWPERRLGDLVASLPAPVLAADRPHAGVALPHWAPDEPTAAAGAPVRRRPVLPADGSSPASVFFTSGTTGTPKGVLSPHRATLRLFRSPGFAAFGPGRVMAQAAPVSWDAFSLELWSMLTTGGTAVVVEGDHLMPGRLRESVAAHGIDTLWLTASLLNLLVDEDPGCFAGLDQVITGGERLSVPHVRAFLAAHPDITLLNGYGPVESCVFATAHRVVPADCGSPTGIPLGRPVPGTRVHVLDGDVPAAAGLVGEICVEGEGLAEGYLGAPDATAAAFVERDLGGGTVRLYRTGDLGRVDADGVLHYHGRRDSQVKVAGHRVEPGEIEAAAREVPGVRDCVAVPVPGGDGATGRIDLFFTASADGPADGHGAMEPAALRRALAEVLPPYMVPHRVHRRDAIPVTPYGKPDRAALAARP